ncbi:MAG TPA: methylated-DNA--[protein]-cysteine S-methyltransferase [Gammaproteobacteria bacterium]|nr:methylated-DNA--[protein]-cysteine S-methyltransferase [Gammaproteobacteria bacterium]
MGLLGIRLQQGVLVELSFLAAGVAPREPASPQAARVVAAIRRYFETPRAAVEVDFRLQGTAFQRRVWEALRTIPAGTTITYGALAARLGSGARAVGNACRRNPLPIVVPCHRVVASRGPGGFAGRRDGRLLEVKRRLLQLEGIETTA